MQLNTFSIVAYDPDEKAWGVAVASKFLAAAALVSWAQADAGAIATQSYAKVGFGPQGLKLLSEGKSASETLSLLLADDDQREQRQIGIVDTNGNVAAHTGKNCNDWAGNKSGQHFSVQGNILTGADVLDAMADSYQNAQGELADRLVAALRAAESAGGDKRGKQSAGVLVVKANGGYGGDTDRYLDLRVDDDEQPVKKLLQLVQAHHLFFGASKAEDQLLIDDEIARELQHIMLNQGYMGGDVNGEWDEVTKQAFWVLVGNENLEERWNLSNNPNQIDRVALEYLRKRFS
ncbi:MAG: DUF1028 domain-containing protein [Phototrophicaceae bacterium]